VFTVAAHAVRVNKPAAALPILITFYISLGLFTLASNWIIQRNLQRSEPLPRAALERSEFPPVSHLALNQSGEPFLYSQL
jgi:hypothetical protein